jgi:hypothetical protein
LLRVTCTAAGCPQIEDKLGAKPRGIPAESPAQTLVMRFDPMAVEARDVLVSARFLAALVATHGTLVRTRG